VKHKSKCRADIWYIKPAGAKRPLIAWDGPAHAVRFVSDRAPLRAPQSTASNCCEVSKELTMQRFPALVIVDHQLDWMLF
jgi:hypothetical protein